MAPFIPTFVPFHCYDMLTRFQMADMARTLFTDAVPTAGMEQFVADFAAYRLDEVLGALKPYRNVVLNAVERTTRRWNIPFSIETAEEFYRTVPTWGPHADVSAGLAKVAREIPLVILSNASDDQIQSNVDKLGAPFHRVYTAQQAQAYKPRLRAFEFMLDSLNCNPDDVLPCRRACATT